MIALGSYDGRTVVFDMRMNQTIFAIESNGKGVAQCSFNNNNLLISGRMS